MRELIIRGKRVFIDIKRFEDSLILRYMRGYKKKEMTIQSGRQNRRMQVALMPPP